MPTIKIVSVGKTKEQWLSDAINEYTKRLKNTLSIEFAFAKDNEQLLSMLKKESNITLFEVEGERVSSEKFSEYIYQHFDHGKSNITFVIGGAEGIPLSIKKQYPTLSISSMTFTHQMCRLIVVEQIYRAREIRKGSQYHK